jgi:hypothetical protein
MEKKTVAQRIADAKARGVKGKDAGRKPTGEEKAALLRAVAERGVNQKRKAEAHFARNPGQVAHKPQGWTPVPCKGNVRVDSYTRTGTINGELRVRKADGTGGIPVTNHCRHKPRE